MINDPSMVLDSVEYDLIQRGTEVINRGNQPLAQPAHQADDFKSISSDPKGMLKIKKAVGKPT